jgi:CDP-diacylglycerol---serine O-phosphatidyltransferase
MENIPINSNPIEVAPRKRRLGRSVFILPSILTVGNIFCGYFAILATMHGNYDQAAQAIGIAILLDMLDGRIARMTNSASDFGLQLDSLADVISFGIAPSILALVWGLSTLSHQLGWIAAFTFTICGAMRLARFNIQTERFRHFVGLPIPAGGGTIAAIVYFFGEPIQRPIYASVMVGTVFLLSILMVSTIRYSSLKYLTLGRRSHLTILGIALFVALVYNYSRQTFLALAIAYSVSGLLHRFYVLVRRKHPATELPMPDLAEHH